MNLPFFATKRLPKDAQLNAINGIDTCRWNGLEILEEESPGCNYFQLPIDFHILQLLTPKKQISYAYRVFFKNICFLLTKP